MFDFQIAEEVQAPAPPNIPHSREAEEAVVGALLINPEMYYEIAEVLSASDFYIHRHRWMWEAFTRLHEQRIPIDLLTLSEEMDKAGQLAEAGGSAYLTAMINQVPSSLNAVSYAHIVKARATARRMIAAANKIAQLGYSESETLDSRLALAEAEWQKVRDGAGSFSRLLPMKALLDKAYDRLEAITKLGRPPGKISSLIDVDKILHGFKKGRYYLVAGRPGDGKTALLLTLARNFMKYEALSVLYVSIEMQESSEYDDPISGGELSERLIGMEADINTTDISDGRLKDGEWPLFTHAIETMGDWRFTVDDDPCVTPDQIVARALKIKGELGLDVVMVDYIQIQETPEGMRFGTRAEQVSYLSRRLKKMCKELDVILIVAAQVNRSFAQRADKRLWLSDLKESGSLEQDPHVVMFLQPTDKLAVKELEVAKHRGGRIGSCELHYEATRTEFRNSSRREETARYWWTEGNGNGKH